MQKNLTYAQSLLKPENAQSRLRVARGIKRRGLEALTGIIDNEGQIAELFQCIEKDFAYEQKPKWLEKLLELYK